MDKHLSIREVLALVEVNLRVNKRASIKTFPYQIKPTLAALADVEARSFTYVDAERYKLGRLEAGAAPATINHELRFLKRGFKLARKAGLVDQVPEIDLLRVANAREGFLEPADMESLAARLDPPLSWLALFAYHTGWRRGECISLRWTEVDWRSGQIRLRAAFSKNRESRVFPLAGRLLEVVRAAWNARFVGEDIAERVFHRGGRPIGNFVVAWKVAVALEGRPELLFHDLRRSFARNASNAGIPQPVIMRLMGLRSDSIFRRYRIVNENDLRSAAERLEAFTASRAAPSS